MKTIQVPLNLYSYGELSDEAKKVAIRNFTNDGLIQLEVTNRYLNTAKAFLAKIDDSFTITDYRLGSIFTNYIKYDFSNLKLKQKFNNKNRTSVLLMSLWFKDVNLSTCSLTGEHTDNPILDMLSSLLSSSGEYSIEEIINICLEKLCVSCQNECTYYVSEDFFLEHYENYYDTEEVLFYEDGNIYKETVSLNLN